MSKLECVNCYKPEGLLYGYAFRCPGCGHTHMLPVGPGNGETYARWSFNGDLDKPTFSPSVFAQGNKQQFDERGEWNGKWEMDAAGQPIPYTCHSFVTDGRIQFLGDCTHALAGQTVDLSESTP
ncbi:MAG: DUF6527 family protein [Rhodoferax sp.]|nr:DUF6527 family protein [Rhodoferax sp.]MDP3652410.1 DUF6527 family protein [Rhodoferax sp.]